METTDTNFCGEFSVHRVMFNNQNKSNATPQSALFAEWKLEIAARVYVSSFSCQWEKDIKSRSLLRRQRHIQSVPFGHVARFV